MNHPLVSVVMSVYNGEKHLRESVDSILNQTFIDFEFIIVNDGSTDGTRAILESYRDERFVLVHQENSGLTKALNAGIVLVKGKYIARQDADDISKPDRLEKQVAFMEARPAVGLLGSRFEFINEKGEVTRQSMLPTDNEVLQERLVRTNQFCHASTLIRREALDKVGGYREFFRYAQDYDLWLRIAEQCEIANLPDMLVQYRELEEAISSEKILLQSRYAWAAAELAQQRRASGSDDLANGIEPSLPHAEAFSTNLQKKLTDFYAQHPGEMLAGLADREMTEDLGWLFARLCTERIEFEAEARQNQEAVNQKEAVLRQRDESIKWRDEAIRQKDEALKQTGEAIKQQEELLKQKDTALNQKDEALRDKDESLKQKDEALMQKNEELRQKNAEISKLDELLQEKNAVIRAREERITDLLNSLSWKITKPLRNIYSILKK